MISTRAFAKALILDIVYPKSTIRRIISKRKHHFIFLCYSTWAYNEFNKEKQSSCSWGLNKYIVKLQHHKQHLFSFFFFRYYIFCFLFIKRVTLGAKIRMVCSLYLYYPFSLSFFLSRREYMRCDTYHKLNSKYFDHTTHSNILCNKMRV